MIEIQKAERRNSAKQTDRVVVTYYTDPLCCWSWAFQEQWERFCNEYGDRVDISYVMGGMIADWKKFSDPVSDISSPAQMGPIWMHAAAVTHTEMNYHIWHKDPPASSYPACIAVRNAFLQSRQAGELYLKAIRRAVMVEQRNIARPDVLAAVADELSERNADVFNADDFREAGSDVAARRAFRDDLQKAAYHKIGRFPTVTFVTGAGSGLIITGFRPFEMLKACMAELSDNA